MTRSWPPHVYRLAIPSPHVKTLWRGDRSGQTVLPFTCPVRVESTCTAPQLYCVCSGASPQAAVQAFSHRVKKGIDSRKDGLFWFRVLRGHSLSWFRFLSLVSVFKCSCMYVRMGTCGCQKTGSCLSFFFASPELACELLMLLSLPPLCRSSRMPDVPLPLVPCEY